MEKGFDQIYFYQGKCLLYHRSSPISLATPIPSHQLVSLQEQGVRQDRKYSVAREARL